MSNLIWDDPVDDEELNKEVDEYGTICYYKKGDRIYHRTNGPAVIGSNGTKFWYQNDLPHRLNGPAEEYYNGYKEWHYKGKYINCSSQQEFEKFLRLQNLKAFW